MDLFSADALGGAGVGLSTVFVGTVIQLARKAIRFLDAFEQRAKTLDAVVKSTTKQIARTRLHQHRVEVLLSRLIEIASYQARAAAGLLGAPQTAIHDPTPPPFSVPIFPPDLEKDDDPP